MSNFINYLMSFISVKNNPKIFFWAQFFGSISFITPVLSLFYLHRGLTLSDILLLFVIDVVFSLIFEVPTGTIADKYGHKISLIISQILLIFSITLWIFAFEKYMFYIAAALAGISCTFHSGVKDALIYESLKESGKEKTMSKVWGKIVSAPQIALALAVIFGAYFAKDLQESQFVFIIILGLFFSLIKLILLFFLKNPKSHELSRQINPFAHLKEAYNFIKKTPTLFWMTIGQMLIYIPFWSFKEIAQPFLTNAGLAVFWIGILYAITYGLIFVILNKVEWIEKRISTKKLIYLFAFSNLLAYMVAYIWGNFLFVVILVFISLFLLRNLRTPIFAQIFNDYITSKSRSTILSLFSGLDSLFDILIIGILSGLASYGLYFVFLGCAISVFIGLLFPIKLASEIERKTSP